MLKDLLLLVHPIFGVLGMLAAIWLFVEILNATSSNGKRIRLASLAVPLFMVLTWIAGGYWYVLYYAQDKATILNGPWPFAHSIIMETKEHVFFITLILSLLLPIVVRGENLTLNRNARIITLWITALIILSVLFLEGTGSLIALGVKMGLMNTINSQ